MRYLLVILFAISFSSSLYAARPGHCGNANQRPCTVLEAFPSCASNLAEVKGRCISRSVNKPKPKVRPRHCGRHNQRPCNVLEFIPSCDRGLQEARGRCLTAQEARPKPKVRPRHCGRHKQRPCNITEFIPSCDRGLLEAKGRCMTANEAREANKPKRPGHCGRHNQRSCYVNEFIPSCERNLQEAKGRCMTSSEAREANKPKRPRYCGRHNQRPCKVNEFIPSCERNLQEAKGRCMTAHEAREANKPKRPGYCGRHQQRPCKVNEFIPSCERNLQEAKGRCMTAHEAREANKPKRPGYCGRHQQRPCNLNEFIPSCEGGLVEARGRCLTKQEAKPKPKLRPADCGRLDQRACGFLEFFPSCEGNLSEVKGRCQSAQNGNASVLSIGATGGNTPVVSNMNTCGGRGQRACCLGELRAVVGVDEKNGAIVDKVLKGIKNVELGACDKGLDEVPGCSGDCACNGGGIANSMCTVKNQRISEPDTGWSGTGGAPTSSARGYADLHLHLFGHMAHGGKLLVGEPYYSECGGVNLPANWEKRPLEERVISQHGATNQADCKNDKLAVNKSLGDTDNYRKIHRGHGLYTVIGGGTGDVAEQSNFGAPVFSGWPVWSSSIHQQSYYKWLERAWRGGLRTVIMYAVTNTALCKATTHVRNNVGVSPKVDCDDPMASIKEQIKAAYKFEAFIQKNHPDQWFKIVKTAAEARQVVKAGKLAVVLGIEVDNLFNCKLKANECLGVNLDQEIDEIYELGVRNVFPVHNFENGYGAPATWQSAIELGNKAVEGSWWQSEECPPGYGYKLTDNVIDAQLDFFKLMLGFGADKAAMPPKRTETASCNKNGLSSLGRVLVKKLMDKGIIVDVDHMSNKSLNDTLKLAKDRAYPAPLIASHVQFFDLNEKKVTHERMRTAQQLFDIKGTGGMIAAMLKDDGLDVPDRLEKKDSVPYITTKHAQTVDDTCRHSSRVFAHMLQYAVDRMGGPVAMGSDFNGMAGHFNPRFGPQACGKNKAEQALQTKKMEYPFILRGFGKFEKQITGDKTFDYNYDGLAHVGLLPDFIEDLKTVGLSNYYLDKLFRSADAYVDVWERAERSAGNTESIRPTNCGRAGQPACMGQYTPCEKGLTNFRGRCAKLY